MTVWQSASAHGSGTDTTCLDGNGESGSINPGEPTLNLCGPHLIQPSMFNGYVCVYACMYVHESVGMVA